MDATLTRPDDRPRIAILWQGMSGYAHAAFTALCDAGADTLVFRSAPAADAPFDEGSITAGLRAHSWTGAPSERDVERALTEFDPHAVLVSSWHIRAYRRAARRRRGRTLRILCMDNQWWGTPKQWLGVATAPWIIRPNYDAVLLPGDRQADFARRLGFGTDRIISGLYAGQVAPFEQLAMNRGGSLPPRAFLFVGRLVHEKGIDVLVDGYARYRTTVSEPWPLIVVGTGPESRLVAGIEGIEALGFVQPTAIPDVFARAGCLVLPSRFEPWAVAIHEATSAELPVICTWVCGASTRLVLDGYNGALVGPGRADELARAFRRISEASDDERRRMGQASAALSRQYSPARWADTLLRRIPELRSSTGMAPWSTHSRPVVAEKWVR